MNATIYFGLVRDALWYAWGRKDANPLQPNFDAEAFAQYYSTLVDQPHRPSIQDAFDGWLSDQT